MIPAKGPFLSGQAALSLESLAGLWSDFLILPLIGGSEQVASSHLNGATPGPHLHSVREVGLAQGRSDASAVLGFLSQRALTLLCGFRLSSEEVGGLALETSADWAPWRCLLPSPAQAVCASVGMWVSPYVTTAADRWLPEGPC